MFKIIQNKSYTKDIKVLIKRHYKFNKLNEVLELLATNQRLSSTYKDHFLKGGWQGFKECHIEDDMLLIYKIEIDTLILFRVGKHSEIFKQK
jgi:mRNA interferase YafQ